MEEAKSGTWRRGPENMRPGCSSHGLAGGQAVLPRPPSSRPGHGHNATSGSLCSRGPSEPSLSQGCGFLLRDRAPHWWAWWVCPACLLRDAQEWSGSLATGRYFPSRLRAGSGAGPARTRPGCPHAPSSCCLSVLTPTRTETFLCLCSWAVRR